ncbi:hypothetical protein GS682_20380 [Nostoc sp. B(2019)]|nr:hypothetical protein [Nostoc sp. B(2019)]
MLDCHGSWCRGDRFNIDDQHRNVNDQHYNNHDQHRKVDDQCCNIGD